MPNQWSPAMLESAIAAAKRRAQLIQHMVDSGWPREKAERVVHDIDMQHVVDEIGMAVMATLPLITPTEMKAVLVTMADRVAELDELVDNDQLRMIRHVMSDVEEVNNEGT